MKKLLLVLLGAILVAFATTTKAKACDADYDPGDPTSFE